MSSSGGKETLRQFEKCVQNQSGRCLYLVLAAVHSLPAAGCVLYIGRWLLAVVDCVWL
jgi:hypothetical protein